MSFDPSHVAPPSAAEADPQPLHQPAGPSEVMHRTRAVDFFERRTPIVYQNRNGPCPLFSICNLLLLKGVISLNPDAGEVSQQKLISLDAKLLMDTNINREDTEIAAALGSKSYNELASGLVELKSRKPTKENKYVEQETVDFAGATTVALKISSPGVSRGSSVSRGRSFDELALSNLAKQHKRRGDLEEQVELTGVLNLSKAKSGDAVDREVSFDTSHSHSSSTNKETPRSERDMVLAEQADKTKESSPFVDDKAIEHRWELIKNFLLSTAKQLTNHGLFCLHKELKENELCVFFRNNHFNTMFKHGGSLYLLVNDQRYISQTDLVWQRLDKVNGDGVFHTSNFTVFKAETPINDSQNEQQTIMSNLDYLAQFDNSTFGNRVPSANPMDMLNEKNLPRAPGSKLLTFDASVVNDFIVKKEWEDLDDYLGKFVASILKKTPDEVVMMHPGLFMIPREEKLLDMLSDEKLEEAESFFQKSIELLRGCQGRFIALDLMCKIDELNTAVKTSYMPAIRRSFEDIGTRISDYIHLYFPGVIRRDNAKAEGLWQFAMKLPKPDKQGRMVYHEFRCLACGWVSGGQCSILHQRSHLLQSREGKSCPKVTQDLLDRLRALDETRGMPTLEKVKDKFSKKRRSSESWISGKDTSSTGSNTSILAGEKKKRSRASSSPSLGTPAIQMNSQLQVMVSKLKKEISAITYHITPSVVPDAQDRLLLLERVVALQKVFKQIIKYARADAIHSASEDLLRLVGLLEDAIDAVTEHITASMIPDAEDRFFLMRRVAVMQQVLLELS